MINVGKSKNASGDGCIQKECDVITNLKSLIDPLELEIKRLGYNTKKMKK